VEKNNGGKGFHYFMRDLCTLLISWSHFTPDESSAKNKLLCTKVINTLVKYSADKTKMIFNTNICKEFFSPLIIPCRDLSEFVAQVEEVDSPQQGHADHDDWDGRQEGGQ